MKAVPDFFRPCFDGICEFCIIFADKILCMEQIERIKTMEQHLDRASQAVIRLSAALDDYAEAQEAIRHWKKCVALFVLKDEEPTIVKVFESDKPGQTGKIRELFDGSLSDFMDSSNE